MPPAVARRCDAVADRCLPVFKVCFFGLHECRFYFAKIMQTSGKESLLLISRVQVILCKDNANEWKESLLLISRVQVILCKDNERRVQQQAKRKFSFIL